MSDDELFTRILYFGTVYLNRTEDETWLTPIGWLLDLIECHQQYTGKAKPKRVMFIDDIIPDGI